MPAIRNVILDWSGTLVDDFGPVLEASNEIFKIHNKPIFTAEEFREKFYLPFTDFYKEYLPELELAELDHHYHTAFKILQTGIAPLPHAMDFLDYLKGFDDIWFATREEIAEWYLKNHHTHIG